MVKKLVVYKTRENTFVRGIVEKRRDKGANDFLVRNVRWFPTKIRMPGGL